MGSLANGTKPRPESINSLAFMGGGGKGIAYLGAIKALEDLKILNRSTEANKMYAGLHGISGASAGCITAFFLAIGLGYDDIHQIVSEKDDKLPGFKFTSFFDFPVDLDISEIKLRQVIYDPVGKSYRPAVKSISTSIFENKLYSFIISPLLKNLDNMNILEKVLMGGDPNYNEGDFNIFNLLFNYKEVYEKIFSVPVAYDDDRGLFNKRITTHFMNNLNYGYGLFSGLKIREFFTKILDVHFLQKNDAFKTIAAQRPDGNSLSSTDVAGTLTFRELYSLTGLNLAITGTNITTGKPVVFSHANPETSNFPVVEAVCISMNIPLIFAPILVTKANAQGVMVDEYYVDGGLMNNFPLHAFNSVKNNNTLALSLQSEFDSKDSLAWLNGIKQKFNFLNYMAGVGAAALYPASDGQVVSEEDEKHVVKIYTDLLSLTEFTPSVFKSVLTVLYKDDKKDSDIVAAVPGPVLMAYQKVREYFSANTFSFYDDKKKFWEGSIKDALDSEKVQLPVYEGNNYRFLNRQLIERYKTYKQKAVDK